MKLVSFTVTVEIEDDDYTKHNINVVLIELEDLLAKKNFGLYDSEVTIE
jgi:hypothetical protein